MLAGYREQLRQEAEQQRRAHEARNRRHPRDPRLQCETPLPEQIEALMRSLPPAQRNRPWSMAELVARLHGRYNPNPCAGEVGRALRALGWTTQRDWSNRGAGRRVWLSPEKPKGVSHLRSDAVDDH